MIPWGRPVTLLAESAGQLAAAQRELVRVGIDRPAAAATGEPSTWVREGERLAAFRRATFADLADLAGRADVAGRADLAGRADPADPADLAGRHPGDGLVVLDVRRSSERAGGFIEGSVHIPVHALHGRLGEIPAGEVWVHCAGGMRAAIAASLLDAAGRQVVAVDDAFTGAEKSGLTVRTA